MTFVVCCPHRTSKRHFKRAMRTPEMDPGSATVVVVGLEGIARMMAFHTIEERVCGNSIQTAELLRLGNVSSMLGRESTNWCSPRTAKLFFPVNRVTDDQVGRLLYRPNEPGILPTGHPALDIEYQLMATIQLINSKRLEFDLVLS
jgi:hypothetical protein